MPMRTRLFTYRYSVTDYFYYRMRYKIDVEDRKKNENEMINLQCPIISTCPHNYHIPPH